MSDKTIDLNLSVYALCAQHPELKEALSQLGFTEIVKPGMMNSVGRVMTLPRGARMRGIALEDVVDKLRELGYTIQQSSV